METPHLLGALLIYLLSLTLWPPSPRYQCCYVARQKKCCKLKQSTLKGGEGKGSGKGLNSRYGGYWKLEKVFFNESVSTILQLVVAVICTSNMFVNSMDYFIFFSLVLFYLYLHMLWKYGAEHTCTCTCIIISTEVILTGCPKELLSLVTVMNSFSLKIIYYCP